MEPGHNSSDNANDAKSKFEAEILSVLSDARVALPEEDILAVVAIRRQVGFMLTLEALILEGECGAARMDDVPKDAPLSFDDFGFYALTDEERAPRLAPFQVNRPRLHHEATSLSGSSSSPAS